MKAFTFTAAGQVFEVPVSEDAAGSLVTQLVGAFTGTIACQASMDDATWLATRGINLNDGTASDRYTNVEGFRRFVTTGFKRFRLQCTSLSAGTPTVYATTPLGEG